MNLAETLQQINKVREGYNAQLANYKAGKGKAPTIKESTINLMESMARNLSGDYSKGRASITEALTTTDTMKLIPKVLEGQMREAAEPEYLGTRFMQTIHVDGGSSAVYVIPICGELRASEISEGGRYNEDNIDFTTIENSALEIRVKKVGLRVTITEEAIADSSWDILGINVRKMGQAMARYKEEQVFTNFSTHGHVIYDNNLRSSIPEAGTTGKGKDGNFNDTLSVEDFLDMVLALMGNGFVPTDVIMHPLTWVVFARNAMLGNGLSFGALGGNNVSPWGTIQGTPGPFGLQNNGDGQKLIMRPEQVQNRLPVPLTVNFSPFVNFDKVNKTFDMYCLDRSEVGVIAEREKMSMGNWTDPEKDIKNLKCKERYGIGMLNNGRAVTVSRNIAVDVSYPEAPIVTVNTKTV